MQRGEGEGQLGGRRVAFFRGRSTETTTASSSSISSSSQRWTKEKFSGPCEWHGRGSLRPCAPPIDPPPPPRRPRSPTASATGDSPGEQQRRAILFHGNATSAGSNAMFGRGRMEVGLKGGGRRELNGLWRGRASLGRGTIWCIFVDERITRSSCLILEYWMRRGVDLRRFLWDETVLFLVVVMMYYIRLLFDFFFFRILE